MTGAPLPLASEPSGMRAWLLSPEPHSRWQARLGRFYLGWRAFSRNPLAVIGLGIVLLLILVAIFADVIAPYSPVAGGDLRTQRLLPPSETFWLGTDDQARDIFSRVI
ncbi:MAG: D-ala-D-ala transporter subunit, partial [Microvirga sp.]|nr:D-ala-D-ala transporter subunit [Microvirga sp.]